MIKLKNYLHRNQYADSLSEQDSSEEIFEDRVRAIRIDEEKNQVHTFQQPSSSVIQEQSGEDDSSVENSKFREDTELQVSESQEDIDELEKRIRKLESNLEKNLKNLPKSQLKQPRVIESQEQNRNTINLTQKSIYKETQKIAKHKINPSKDKSKFNYKYILNKHRNQSQKLKQSIKTKCDKALNLRKDRQQLVQIRNNLTIENKLSQVQRELQLLKMIDSLELKLRTSINKKVATMHQQIEEASLRKGKLSSKESRRGR